MSDKMKKCTDKNYSQIKKLRKSNECLFRNIGIECSNKGKHETEENHLIQKASYLERIACKNKVMIFDFENRDYIKNGRQLVKRNIRSANTYHVLCGNHDKYLFNEIENGKKFDESNPKQLFQFALRAFIFHFSEEELKNKFDNIVTAEANKVAAAHLELNKKRLEIYKEAVSKGKCDSVETKVIRLKSKVEFISCYAGTPNLGFVFPIRFINCMISLNIFPEDDDTIILLSYLKEDIYANTAAKFCNKLEKLYQNNAKKFLQYINKFVIAFDHNIAINPTYWEKLSDREQKDFYEMAHIFPKCKSIKAGLKGYLKLRYKKYCINLFSK